MPDSDYRYLGFQTACRFEKNRVVARIQKAVRHIIENESQLKEMVYTYGPVAAGILVKSFVRTYIIT